MPSGSWQHQAQCSTERGRPGEGQPTSHQTSKGHMDSSSPSASQETRDCCGHWRAKSEMAPSRVTQAVISQNCRYLGHLARTSGIVTNLGIYIIFQIKNKQIQARYFLPIESFWNIRWQIVSLLTTNGTQGFILRYSPGLNQRSPHLKFSLPTLQGG